MSEPTALSPKIKFGFHLPGSKLSPGGKELIDWVIEMEQAGYHSVWTSDHVIVPWDVPQRYNRDDVPVDLDPHQTCPDPLVTLAFVAAQTRSLKLGTSVLVLPHRHPLPLAKAIATLDVLSAGRVIVGVGVGWLRPEVEALGIDFNRRGRWSDEAIRVMRSAWLSERVVFHGEFFSFGPSAMYPKPVQACVPLWVGGHSPAAFKRAATLGTGWHGATNSEEKLNSSLRQLKEAAIRAGRDMVELELSIRLTFSFRDTSVDGLMMHGTVSNLVEDCRKLRKLSISQILLEAAYPTAELKRRAYRMFANDVMPYCND
ncbi:hypothetical protein CK218_12835 [Mesorhizobium sp. WSM3879]|uniref:TIGR03619 family F420-dependent LLM class oxidoreductase n=1 Tax=Mesorhizobium sp. WSM3879 TaxID=2029406 RepID=UPI000BAF418F|nr:TIGR03619 family F420-dependent LLM class oxidoreductase [Mesorhizobium sp. WSM3879]PBB81244.1 hypothetical protein CK218_12835 [Mesorhizobium sp. WSM3879]